MNNNKTKTLALIAALTLAGSLTACGGGDSEPAKTKTVTQSSSTTEPEAETADAEPEADVEPEYPTTDDADSMIVKLGEEFIWEDSTTVKISEPEPYTPDEYAAGGEGYPEVVSVDVTITNGGTSPLDVSFVTPTVTSGGSAGDEVFDDTVGMGPETALLPGKTVTFTSAYGVEDSSDVVFEFAPTWDHDYAYWTN